MSSEKGPFFPGHVIFQPSILEGYVSFQRGKSSKTAWIQLLDSPPKNPPKKTFAAGEWHGRAAWPQ